MPPPSGALNDVLLHPARMRIILALAGRELTPSQLRAELPDVPQASLYKHLARLTRAGALRVVAERPVRGAVERVYALDEGSPTLRPANPTQVTPEELRRLYAVFLAAQLADGSRYLASEGADPFRDGFGFRQVALNLSEDEWQAMARALNAALAPYLALEPSPERRRRSFATILIPQQPAAPDEPPPAPDVS